ncbi:MAG: hypothetical protein ACXAE3_11655 [Candidatus Kariarchaeaceae archaeon]|jgi:hypothetical protein
MAIDTQQGERGISRNRQYLAYRETLLLSLGLMTQKLNQVQFYDLYSRIHERLRQAQIVEFSLPEQAAFEAMIRKLIKIGDIHHVYSDGTYILTLTDQGTAKFDLFMLSLADHPKLDRIIHIVEYFRTAPVFN